MKEYKVEFFVIEYIEAEDELDAKDKMVETVGYMRYSEMVENMEVSEVVE